MTRHTIPPHNRICHQGMRSQDTGEQQRSAQAEVQKGHPYPHTSGKRNTERQYPEHECLGKILLQILQVHFKTGQEHDVINTHLPEELETAVTLQILKPY